MIAVDASGLYFVPRNAAEGSFFLIGVFLGILFALNGWAVQPGIGGPLRRSPRVTNLVWLVTGFFGSLFAEWAELGIITEGSTGANSHMMWAYLVGLFAAVTVTLTGLTAIIALLVALAARNKNVAGGPDSWILVVRYLHYGLPSIYGDLRRALRSPSANAAEDSSERIREAYRTLAGLTAFALNTPPEARKTSAQAIMKAVSDLVSRHVGTPEGVSIRTNYMSLEVNDGAEEQDGEVFIWGDRSRYQYWLVLDCYELGIDLKRPVRLGVPSGEYEDEALFGAPTAVINKGTEVVSDTTKLNFAKDVPRDIRREIRDYFAREAPHFRSFASVCAYANREVIGVVNIESSSPDVFGADAKLQKELADIVLPYCTLISTLIRDEATHGR